jgi:hypothetical protein
MPTRRIRTSITSTRRSGDTPNCCPCHHQEPDQTSSSLLELTNVILRQIEFQQEVRDRWFNYYLLINAATATLATTFLKLFSKSGRGIYAAAAIPLLLAGGIGICFFHLYMRQRRNYLSHYTLLAAVQKEMVSRIVDSPYETFYPARLPLERQIRGADYFTLMVQALLISSYFGASTALAIAAVGGVLPIAASGGVAIAAGSAVLLGTLRARFERT